MNESMKMPEPKFSVQEEEVEKIRKEAEDKGDNPDEAEIAFRKKIQRANLHLVKEGEQKLETMEEKRERMIRETEEGIADGLK